MDIEKEIREIKNMLRFIIRELTYVPDYPPKKTTKTRHLKPVK